MEAFLTHGTDAFRRYSARRACAKGNVETPPLRRCSPLRLIVQEQKVCRQVSRRGWWNYLAGTGPT